jgi:hypothetical protein
MGVKTGRENNMNARQTKAKKKFPIWVLIILGFFTLCFVCITASVAMDQLGLLPTLTPAPPTNTALPSETPGPTNTPGPTDTPTAAPLPIDQLRLEIEKALGDGNREIPRLTEFNWSESDKTLIIQWALNDNLSQDLIMVGVQTDITDMLKVISTSGLLPEFQFVTFVGTFPLVDKFGNVTEDRVVTANYNKSTVDKINWDNFLYTNIFDIAELSFIHPAMTQP